MKGKRTGLDFSEHEMIVTENENVSIHYLKKPGTVCDSIKYINCGGILAVTGDYGNWIFCRSFYPSEKEFVSEHYWHEKLRNSSTQEAMDFDGDATKEELKRVLEEYKEECKEEEKEPDEDVVEYYEQCMSKCDEHELDYTHYAYREQPDGMDYDNVILLKDYKSWLKTVFDGFDEMCRRIKEEKEKAI